MRAQHEPREAVVAHPRLLAHLWPPYAPVALEGVSARVLGRGVATGMGGSQGWGSGLAEAWRWACSCTEAAGRGCTRRILAGPGASPEGSGCTDTRGGAQSHGPQDLAPTPVPPQQTSSPSRWDWPSPPDRGASESKLHGAAARRQGKGAGLLAGPPCPPPRTPLRWPPHPPLALQIKNAVSRPYKPAACTSDHWRHGLVGAARARTVAAPVRGPAPPRPNQRREESTTRKAFRPFS
jgi:hypothetical protein